MLRSFTKEFLTLSSHCLVLKGQEATGGIYLLYKGLWKPWTVWCSSGKTGRAGVQVHQYLLYSFPTLQSLTWHPEVHTWYREDSEGKEKNGVGIWGREDDELHKLLVTLRAPKWTIKNILWASFAAGVQLRSAQGLRGGSSSPDRPPSLKVLKLWSRLHLNPSA